MKILLLKLKKKVTFKDFSHRPKSRTNLFTIITAPQESTALLSSFHLNRHIGISSGD